MWAERMNFDKGEWSFFSPCTVQRTVQGTAEQGTVDAKVGKAGKAGKTSQTGKAGKTAKGEPGQPVGQPVGQRVGQRVGAFTSSVYSSPGKPCGQHLTTNSSIGTHGTSLTVGPSYQLSYSRCGKRRGREETGAWLCVRVCVYVCVCVCMCVCVCAAFKGR